MIKVALDDIMTARKISTQELAEAVGITRANISRMRRGAVTAVRFDTLEALCRVLECEPGDILKRG